MSNYQRKPEDRQFRRVPLRADHVPPYSDFTGDTITGLTDSLVLEVLKTDGSEERIYSGQRVNVDYQRAGNYLELLSDSGKPYLARMWLRECGGSGMWYKTPDEWGVNANNHSCLYLQGGTENLELCGDKYLECACCFTRR